MDVTSLAIVEEKELIVREDTHQKVRNFTEFSEKSRNTSLSSKIKLRCKKLMR
jgi:hypothetical protein